MSEGLDLGHNSKQIWNETSIQWCILQGSFLCLECHGPICWWVTLSAEFTQEALLLWNSASSLGFPSHTCRMVALWGQQGSSKQVS